MVMGCDIIDSWAMNHFGKLRDINVSIIPENYLDRPIALALLCLHLAMKWFHLLTEKSRILKYILKNWKVFQNDKFVLFKEVIFTVWFKNKNLNFKKCDPAL
jgi:hypothetical protein